MKEIKICFIHPTYHSVEELYSYFKLPQDKYNLVWDDKQPDYIIASEWIYKDKKYYQRFLSLQSDKTINIFHAGEAMSPDLNFFDYISDSDEYFSLKLSFYLDVLISILNCNYQNSLLKRNHHFCTYQ